MATKPIGRCFAPVADAEARILILGSLPGQRSLADQKYYAHPQNQFWRLIGGVIGIDLVILDYDARLETLVRHRIALWDTVAEAQRAGSLDSAIREAAPNDLTALVNRLPALRLIAFNGQKASSIGLRQLTRCTHVDTIVLPSSSPAYTLPFASKLSAWSTSLRPALSSKS